MIHPVSGLTELGFGITQYGDAPPHIPLELVHLIGFTEFRINQAGELARRLTNQRPCVVHAPDPEEDGFLEVIQEVSARSNVFAVNVHARPNDEEWLCASCARRWTAAQAAHGPCTHCGAPDLAAWRGTFPFAAASKLLIQAADMLRACGKKLFIENTCESPELMARVLAAVPTADFTLDTGHSMLYGDGPESYLTRLGSRLRHLHLHDNLGGDSERLHDLHLPPGQGVIDWPRLTSALQAHQFRGTAVFECEPTPASVHLLTGVARLLTEDHPRSN